MKLLFDEHLSYKLVHRLSDIFPNSKHAKDLQLENDLKIWEFAKTHNFIIVTKDADFIDIIDLLIDKITKLIRMEHHMMSG